MTDDIFTVVDRPLSPDAIAEAVDDPGAGGVVIFSGVVRNQTDGRPVKFLEDEAHAPMAEAKMREIGVEIRARWSGVRRLAMLHRIGRLEIGESSVLLAVSAAHRGDAFEACRTPARSRPPRAAHGTPRSRPRPDASAPRASRSATPRTTRRRPR